MKRMYTKPSVVIEMFTLTQSIAKDCADNIVKEQVDFNEYPCKWDLGGGMTVFIMLDNCIIDGSSMGFSCYNNPSESGSMFRS